MTSSNDPSSPPQVAPRRFPAAVYLTGVALVITAFLLEIWRGECPVP